MEAFNAIGEAASSDRRWKRRGCSVEPTSIWLDRELHRVQCCWRVHLHVLQWFCEYEYPDWPPRRYGLNNIDSAASSGAAHGHLAILEWLYEAISYRATPEMLGAAAERGQLDVFRWVYQRDGNAAMTSDVMDIATGNGHLPLVKWLHEHSSAGCTKAAMDDAASCDLDVIQWLHSHRSEGCTTNAMVQAAHYGHLDVVVWLHKHRAEGCAEDSVDPISVHVLKWFAANRSYKGTSEAMEAAAQRGDLESLKVRLGIGSQVPSVSVAASAAIRGHLGVLEWIYERYPAQFDVEKVREQGEKHPYVNAWLESVCDYSSEVC